MKSLPLNQRMKLYCASSRTAVEAADVGFLYPSDGWSILAAILRSDVPAGPNSNACYTFMSSQIRNETSLDDSGIALV